MHYTKMHGAGNEFVLVENLNNELEGADLSALAVQLCGRETGPGADGMIVVMPADPAEADYAMLFYNQDGTLGEMCGNGARCIARYGVEHGLARDDKNIRFKTTAGLVTGRHILENLYQVRLNDPSVIDLHRIAEAGGEEYDCSYLELGNPGIPHAVVITPAEDFFDLDALRERGRELRWSKAFPRGANVTFACLRGEKSVKAVTFERGVEDFTLACGTGCGATASTFVLRNLIPGEDVNIDMPGGKLSVHLTRTGDTVSDILLTGPTAVVGEGEI